MSINPAFLGSGEVSLISTPGNVLQTVLNTDVLTGAVNGWFDAGPYQTMNVTLIGGATITAGAVTFEQTNDPTVGSGRPIPVRDAESVTATAVVAAITVTSAFYKQYVVPLTARYVRIRVSTAFTGGATGVRAVAEFTRGYVAADMNNSVVASGTVAISGTPNVNLASSTAPTVHTLNSAATTNATSVKASAGRIYTIVLSNQNAAARFFKLYQKASAPTVGTDIPVLVVPVPATSVVNLSFSDFGLQVGTGIAYAVTGAIGDTDTTVIAAGDFKVNMQYV